ncbi:MAG: nuclear transport factor 2 family protein [Porticoccaceae bacterium]|jgi:ketosteroid isomerase-like protein
MNDSQQSVIDVLVAREAIRDLVSLYCRAVDRGDIELVRSLYHEDALDEHGYNKAGTAAEFIDGIAELQKNMHVLQHNITNHIIRVNGDEAEGEVYVVAYHVFEGETGPTSLINGGRYLDRYQRRDNGPWKFSHRRCIADWSHRFPIQDLLPDQTFNDGSMPVGRIDEDDPSYGFFTLFRRGVRTD